MKVTLNPECKIMKGEWLNYGKGTNQKGILGMLSDIAFNLNSKRYSVTTRYVLLSLNCGQKV